MQFSTGALPKASPLWSPRVGFNWDVAGKRSTQVRGGTGVFTGKPPYVWISNQIGNTGVLTGFVQAENTNAFPFTTDTERYKPTNVTGAPAASVDLAVTDADFKFPQTWRTNIGVDQRLPWGIIGTAEFIYNKDVNGVVLHQRQPAGGAVGVHRRRQSPALDRHVVRASRTPRRCVTRLNNAAGNQITNAIVLTNQNDGRSWNFAGSVHQEPAGRSAACKAAYSYGESKNTDRSRLGRRRIVHRQRHQRRPEQPGAGLLGKLARPPHVHQRHLHQAVLQLRRRRACRCSGTPSPAATPATCSRAT